jgi:signal transduction histidine kinase
VQLQQALMNLMLNGIEAMRDTSCELSINARLAENGQLLISVADTGMGLSADNRDKIFDPLFTTKDQGIKVQVWAGTPRIRDGEQRVTLRFPVHLRPLHEFLWITEDLPV